MTKFIQKILNEGKIIKLQNPNTKSISLIKIIQNPTK